MSSSSVASSTMPSVASSASIARSIETGSPIWMADANVFCALTGLYVSHPALYALYRGLALCACKSKPLSGLSQAKDMVLVLARSVQNA